MTIGGSIFFGVYETCMQLLLALHGRGYDQPDKFAELDPEIDAAITRQTRSPQRAASLRGAMSEAGGEIAHLQEAARTRVALVAMAAGGMAGMMTDTILYPIDTRKTRLIKGIKPPLPSRISHLWSGLTIAIVPAVPAAASFFVTYEYAKARTRCIHEISHSSHALSVLYLRMLPRSRRSACTTKAHPPRRSPSLACSRPHSPRRCPSSCACPPSSSRCSCRRNPIVIRSPSHQEHYRT